MLWVLAERCLMPSLQNELITNLISHLDLEATALKVNMEFIHYACKTIGASPLKQLMIYATTMLIPRKELKSCVGELPEGMVVDMIMILRRCLNDVRKGSNGRILKRECYLVEEVDP